MEFINAEERFKQSQENENKAVVKELDKINPLIEAAAQKGCYSIKLDNKPSVAATDFLKKHGYTVERAGYDDPRGTTSSYWKLSWG